MYALEYRVPNASDVYDPSNWRVLENKTTTVPQITRIRQLFKEKDPEYENWVCLGVFASMDKADHARRVFTKRLSQSETSTSTSSL